jgi:hypothetical protein
MDHSMANELGGLMQGVSDHFKVTDTIFFIPRKDVPVG